MATAWEDPNQARELFCSPWCFVKLSELGIQPNGTELIMTLPTWSTVHCTVHGVSPAFSGADEKMEDGKR